LSDRAIARHRAPQRPLTPLDSLTDTLTGGLTVVSDSIGSVGRSGAVLAVSTGLVATMGLPANAVTKTAPENGAAFARSTVVTAAAVALPASVTNGAAVSAPASAKLTFERDALAVKKAKPKPKPKVVQELRTTQKASRSSERAAPKAATTTSRSDVLAIARQYIGTPYRYGGTTPGGGFDCSGFTQYVLRKVGISVPRTSQQQYAAATKISRGEARPGDLVFIFTGGRVTHMGFYLGGNRMIDSPRSGKSIQEREIWSSNIAFGRP
jgi:peptidoglycan DL-endopeptidase CwlO